MVRNAKASDAWDDDDWEAQADRAAEEELQKMQKKHAGLAEIGQGGAPLISPPSPPPVVMSRSERLAKHTEEQRKLWEAAETPLEIPFVATTSVVPLAQPIRPAVKVLSRKPPPTTIVSRRDPLTGCIERLTIRDADLDGGSDDDDDDDEFCPSGKTKKKKNKETPEEIRARQQCEREAKQRRYDEARAKIFGEDPASKKALFSNPPSGRSSPGGPLPGGSATPPQSRCSGGRGRGGWGANGRGGGYNHGCGRQEQVPDSGGRSSPYHISNHQHSGSGSGTTRELYDHNYSPRPAASIQRHGRDASQSNSKLSTAREEVQAVRSPHGPDATGRGGFFARRDGAGEG